ncbi:MAG: hypothetical protein JW806_06485 [Sedimentisphaerales bacterium]|nr:hypothetical protein [Sedimentisphaerales bacterium]
MKVDFRNLPKIKIIKISNAKDGICIVQFSSKDCMYNGWADIFATPVKLISGKFKLLSDNTGELSLETPSDISRLKSGEEYEFMDGYWGERAQFVLEETVWTKIDFKTQDCYGQRDEKTGKITVMSAPGFVPPKDDKSWVLVENGWDHEHCGICWETICDKGCHDQVCYINSNNVYICESCYEKYISKKNWDFTELNKESDDE